MVAVYAGYRGYTMVVAPLTIPVVELPVAGTTVPQSSHLPTDAENVAKTYLPDEKWIPNAKISGRIGQGAYTYFDKRRRIEDGRKNSVRLQPFAAVWFDPKKPGGAPYTLTATTAVIEFEDTFHFGRSQPGAHRRGKTNRKGPNHRPGRTSAHWSGL